MVFQYVFTWRVVFNANVLRIKVNKIPSCHNLKLLLQGTFHVKIIYGK